MNANCFRRLIGVLLAFVLVATPIASGAAINCLNVSPAVTMGMTPSQDCDHPTLVDDNLNCFAHCASIAVLPTPSLEAAVPRPALAWDVIAVQLVDHRVAPEPHPPKSV